MVLPRSIPIDLICMVMILRLAFCQQLSSTLVGLLDGGPSHYRDYTNNHRNPLTSSSSVVGVFPKQFFLEQRNGSLRLLIVNDLAATNLKGFWNAT